MYRMYWQPTTVSLTIIQLQFELELLELACEEMRFVP